LLAKQLESQVTIQRQKLGNIILLILMLGLAFGGYFLHKSLKQKKKYNVELEGEVEKRTKQLQVSNEELLKTNQNLEQSNNELERFAYIASHDLKSPLRNIISFLNLIQRKLKGHSDTDLQEYLRFATENAKQMHSLIQDVLEFSKVEAEPTGKKEKIDMNESMMLVVQNLNESIKETNAEIITETLPIVEANSVHLLQLLQNLVGNGIKYNKNHNPKVEVKYNLVNGFHLFTVKDNGIGIDKQYHDQIFEMFKRLHTRDEYKGTGIGLAICKKIVMSLGGRLWLDSDYGKGSTFYFTVPV
jgi:light-regulated signal transduction histidine kinase (bacteriophytochrome)